MARGLNNNHDNLGVSHFCFYSSAYCVLHALLSNSIPQAECGNEIDTLPASELELLWSSIFPTGFIQPITDFVSRSLIPSKVNQLTLGIYILQAPRAQKIRLSCLFGITLGVPTRKIEYFIDHACSVRISTLSRSRSINTHKERTWPISSDFDLGSGRGPKLYKAVSLFPC